MVGKSMISFCTPIGEHKQISQRWVRIEMKGERKKEAKSEQEGRRGGKERGQGPDTLPLEA